MWNDDNTGFGNEGGGFDNTNNMFESPAPTSKSGPKPRCIAPVAIKQILDCSEDGLKLKDIDIQVVKVLGIVKLIDTSTIKVSYTVEDPTGSILGVSYLDTDSEDNAVPVIENTYCVMIGSVRSQSGSKHIMIFNIYPVTDFNEITEHYLAVIHMALKAEAIASEGAERSSDLKQDMMASYGTNYGNDNASTVDMDPKYKRIYDIICRSMSESGMNIDEIRSSMSIKMPLDQIRGALDYLIGEGHIFTTIDDNHFKSTGTY